jgi:hypothetical protein
MARGAPHDAHVRVKAVARVLAGQSLYEVAHDLGVPRRTIAHWVGLVDRGAIARHLSARRDAQERHFNALLADYLADLLRALQAQARQAGDPAWLAQQNARQLATWYEVTADTAFRLVGALQVEDRTS